MMIFECKVCKVKDEVIAELKKDGCKVCAQKDEMIKHMKGLLDSREKSLSEINDEIRYWKNENKRLMDRLLEKNNVAPVREEVAGHNEFDMNKMFNVYETEVPLGEN